MKHLQKKYVLNSEGGKLIIILERLLFIEFEERKLQNGKQLTVSIKLKLQKNHLLHCFTAIDR
jgi:hypothetical protein